MTASFASFALFLAAPSGSSHSGGSTGGWLAAVIGSLIFVLAVTMAIKPQLQWKMNRWQFKRPEATEPSRAGLLAIRISSSIVAVFALVFVIIAIT